MTAGRPSTYSEEITDRICEMLEDGMSLRSICLLDDMPGRRTVLDWLDLHEEFRTKYARAREKQADADADDIVDISDHEPDPARARVRVDARKWRAAKLAPKKYGDRITHAGDESAPLNVQIVRFSDASK